MSGNLTAVVRADTSGLTRQIHSAKQMIQQFTEEMRQSGSAVSGVSREQVNAYNRVVNGLNKVIDGTKNTHQAQKLLQQQIKELKIQWANLDNTARSSDFGKSISTSIQEAKSHLKSLNQQLDQTKEKIRETANATPKGGMQDFMANSGKIGSTMSQIGSMVSNPYIAAGAAVAGTVAALTDFTKAAVGAYRKTEQLQTGLTTLVGSAGKAESLFKDISSYGAKTPYNTDGLTKATQLMLSYGTAVEDVMPTLKMLGDIGMGSQEKLMGLTLAFSQMSSAGKVTKQDLNQMVNAGFNPLQEIARTTGQTLGQVNEKLSKGKISVDDIKRAFQSATQEGGKFHNMAANMADTLEGKISTLDDNWNTFLSDFGKAVSPAVEVALDALNSGLKKAQNLLDTMRGIKPGDKDNSKKEKHLTANAYSWGGKKLSDAKDEHEWNQMRKKIEKELKAKRDKSRAKYHESVSYSANKRKEYGVDDINTTRERDAKKLYERDEKYLSDLRKLKNPYKKTAPTPQIPTDDNESDNTTSYRSTKTEVYKQGEVGYYKEKISELQKQLNHASSPSEVADINAKIEVLEDQIDAITDKNLYGQNKAKFEGKSAIQKPDAAQVETDYNLDTNGAQFVTPTLDVIKGSTEDMKDLNREMDDFQHYSSAVSSVGNAFSQLGNAIGGANGQVISMVGTFATAASEIISQVGTIIAAKKAESIANGVAGASQAPWFIAIPAIASIVATIVSTFASIGSFANGGIISGASSIGDHNIARVNSGEMILNGTQQKHLFNLIDKGGTTGSSVAVSGGSIKIKGSDLYVALKNYSKASPNSKTL